MAAIDQRLRPDAARGSAGQVGAPRRDAADHAHRVGDRRDRMPPRGRRSHRCRPRSADQGPAAHGAAAHEGPVLVQGVPPPRAALARLRTLVLRAGLRPVHRCHPPREARLASAAHNLEHRGRPRRWTRSHRAGRTHGKRQGPHPRRPARRLRPRARGRELARRVAAPVRLQDVDPQGPRPAHPGADRRAQRSRHAGLHRWRAPPRATSTRWWRGWTRRSSAASRS